MNRAGRIATLAAGAGLVGALVVAERKRPLRRRTMPVAPRTAHNLAMGLACAAVIEAVEKPLTERIAERNVARGRGLAGFVPGPIKALTTLLVMDYTFYLWHVATHKVPLLWRIHRVHHVDPDLDASTAIRFHFIDMIVSLPWRLVQVRLSGASPRGLAMWRGFFNASILFHHANLRLPRGWDRKLSWLLTTPEMHGIHHSRAVNERDSNWSSGISLWDRLHGTFRDRPSQRDLDIGVQSGEPEEAASLAISIAAPFSGRIGQ
ncbi:MAG: sterol desaturase family protein [Novosphingobium sp.]|nr:sterol desaturase family protein [Novosphingobium sp.]